MLLVTISIIDVAYFGDNSGSLTALAAGAAPFSFQWSTLPVQTTATAVNLTANIYTVTVTHLQYNITELKSENVKG